MGSSHILKTEWSRRPGPKDLRPYIAWMNSINKQLADEWGLKIMHVYQTIPTGCEVWVYEPGRPPKREYFPIA